MNDNEVRGEAHGCIVCGKLHQTYVVYSKSGKFIDFKVMSADGVRVSHPSRPLVACSTHTEEQIKTALGRYAQIQKDDED